MRPLTKKLLVGLFLVFLLLPSIINIIPNQAARTSKVIVGPNTASTSLGIQYTKTWGGYGGDGGGGVAVDASGNIYVTGWTYSFGPGAGGRSALLLLKYNPSGKLQWQRIWSGSGSDIGDAVAVDASGNIYVTGSTNSTGASGDVVLLKFDSTGTLLWQRTWGGSNPGSSEDGGSAIALDALDNIYVTGYTISSSGGASSDVVLLKFDSSGNLVWQKTWGSNTIFGVGTDYGYGVVVDAFGNIYVTGTTMSSDGNWAGFLLKFDSTGSLVWQKIWGGEGSNAVAVDASGNIYVTGCASSFGAGSDDVLLLKFDPTGALLGQKTWGGNSGECGYSVALDDSGNIYVTGYTASFRAGWGLDLGDVFLLKLNATGSLLNQEIYGGAGSSNDFGYGVAVDSAGDVFITGSVSEAPPYASTTTGNATFGTPTLSFGTPSFTFDTPSYTPGTPTGSVSTPSGSETYGGGDDLFLTLYGPAPTYQVTLQTSAGIGSIYVNGITYTDGQSVTLTAGIYTAWATPPLGYAFTNWTSSGGITLTSSAAIATTINITGTATLTATFTPIPTVTVTFNDNPASGGSITCDTQTFSNGQSGQFTQNTWITCTADAAANQQFSRWTGLATGSGNPINFYVGSGGSVTANYTPILVTVTFHEDPASAGTITCGTQSFVDGQSGQFQQNSLITCTANPASGYLFSSWSGLAPSTTNPTTFNVGTGGSISASFTAAQGTVTFNDNPSSGGTITCGSQTFSDGQTAQFAQNSMLSCTANPAANYQFSSWGGLASGTANPVTFNVTSGGSLIANFSPNQVSVTFNDNPASGGTIICGTQTFSNGQSGEFQQGSQITCTATAAAGYQFSGWVGLASGTSNPVSFNVGTGGSITANFTPTVVMVTVTFGDSPISGGSITCSAKTYSNGQTNQFAQGSSLTCTANASAGHRFAGWTGLASGPTNPVTFSVGSGGSLTASFTLITSTPTPLTPNMILLNTLLASAILALIKRSKNSPAERR